jgi:type I restriction enzyme S subunit
MSDHAWASSALVDIAVAIKDGSHGSHKRISDGVPLLSAKNVTERGNLHWDESDERVSAEDYAAICSSFAPERDDLLLTIVGTLGRRALFDGARVAFQRSVAFVRPDQRRVRPRYLFHAVASPDYVRQLTRRSNATAQAGLYLHELAKTRVPVPTLDDQARIAAVLDTADEVIAKTQAVITKLKQIRSGLLHDLLTCGLDEHGQLRDQIAQPEQFKDSPLGRVPREWDVDTLVSRISLPQGQVDPKGLPYLEWILIAPDHVESETGRLISRQTAAEQGAISGKYVTLSTARSVLTCVRLCWRKRKAFVAPTCIPCGRLLT